MPGRGRFTIKALGPDTWDGFAALVEKHRGIFGGCWCTWFHTMSSEKAREAGANRRLKEQLVRADRAHAALVYDGDAVIGWCQFGAPGELPNINHRRQVETADYRPPDYRLTCVFVDRDRRGEGVAEAAVRGALELIAASGGGVVETYPQDTGGERVTASFLYNGTRSMFEDLGFAHVHDKGKHHTVMRRSVRAKPGTARRHRADP